ncbi:hypothetical protein NQ314_007255 [Rhamnusium bicolor]|uniref:DJ-1/PfpI domain-containing protein n=1 Tax=Rhamnusium bicolor TaxID=1586634 RepID=A0AAV8YQC3_9CUCU|nr:hypothetical protein NQ314_007255 [Rhamnusium bicolor]
MSQQGYVDKRCSSCFAGARRKQISESQLTKSCNMSKTALVFLAPGAEEMEAVIAIDVLRRGGVNVTVAGVPDSSVVKCSRDVNIKPDISVTEAKGPYDVLVLPGGLGGSNALGSSKEVGDLLKQQENDGRIIAAICAAPTALKSHRVAFGKNITSYPSMKPQLEEGSHYHYEEDKVVVDDNIITSRGPGTAFDFALTIVDKLLGKEKASEVAKAMLLTY